MISLRNGLKVAYQEFGAHNAKKVIALHGWLDNSSSFQILGPQLANNGYHVLALDHIGHGHSSHLPANSMYQMPNYVSIVKNVLGELGWTKASIVGHSMGGAIGLLYAAAFRDIDKLVVIDNLGPMTFPADQATSVLKKYIEFQEKALSKTAATAAAFKATNIKIDGTSNSNNKPLAKFNINPDGSQHIEKANNNSINSKGAEGYMKGLQVTGGGGKVYDTIADAVNARLKTVTNLPGKQYLSKEAAEGLVKRGVIALDQSIEANSNSQSTFYSNSTSGPVSFRHDPRLSHPSPIYFTPEHVNNFIDNIACPVLVITGIDGWPISSADEINVRVKILTDKNLLTYYSLPGSHHLHLDPNSAPLVTDKILDFLAK